MITPLEPTEAEALATRSLAYDSNAFVLETIFMSAGRTDVIADSKSLLAKATFAKSKTIRNAKLVFFIVLLLLDISFD